MDKEQKKKDKLSEQFQQVFKDEQKRSRVWLLVDAILEENPNISSEEAFAEAMYIVTENPQEVVEEHNIIDVGEKADD